MSSSAFGRMKEFTPDTESISAYLERLQLYFDANSIAEDKRVSVFAEAKHYTLLRGQIYQRTRVWTSCATF